MLRFVLAALLLCAPALANLHDDLMETGREMRGLDLDDDGAPELRAVIPVDGTARETEDAPLALILLEARLLESPDGMTDLRPHLDTYLDDLADEGWSAAAVSCDLYGGDRHQDGLTLLALREYLRAVHSARPELRAALLIGAFPDAHLVRQVNWWKHGSITLNAETASERIYDDEEGIDYLRSYPESVCFRTDLILGDLDGHWEDLYHRERTAVPYVIAAFSEGRAAAGFGPDAIEEGTVEFEDFFFVNDGEYRIHTGPDGRILVSPLPSSHAECAPDDLLQPNPMARPEVLIGRLDARHAAVIPDPDLTDAHGRTLLADDGTPQVLEFDSEEDAPAPRSYYVPSQPVERRMLAEWFERRHAHHAGVDPELRLAGSIGTGWGSAIPAIQAAFADLKDAPPEGYDDVREDMNLLEVVEWLKRPAVIRSMKAHGDPWGCTWAEAPDVAALEAACGPKLWSWKHDGAVLTPGISTPGKLDFAITRSLYESGHVPDVGSIWLYTSCEGTKVAGAETLPYNHPDYGHWQGAECFLFHISGLALIGRSKVFYDEPREMWSVLGEGGTMGDVWRHYFEVEADDAGLFTDNDIGRKRAYFWNILGDPTVRVAEAESD